MRHIACIGFGVALAGTMILASQSRAMDMFPDANTLTHRSVSKKTFFLYVTASGGIMAS